MNKRKLSNRSGFSIIEVIVAMAIFVMIATAGTTTVLNSFIVNRLAEEETFADLYAQEGIEAVRSIKNRSWSNLIEGTYYLTKSGNKWNFSGTPDPNGKYTRQIVIVSGQRDDCNGNIVDASGTTDDDLFKVTSTVNWNFSPTRANSINLVTYLTNFRKTIIGDWSNPQQEGTPVNFSSTENGDKIAVYDNWAFVTRTSGSPDFIAVNITDPANSQQEGSLALNGGPRNLVISEDGNWAFVVSSDNNELQIIDISDPANIDSGDVTYFPLPGTADANGIYRTGPTLYIVRDASGLPDLAVVDVSKPTSPEVLGQEELDGGNNNEIVIVGTYAFVVSDSNTEEIKVIDVSNPGTPTKVDAASVNLPGTSNSETIDGFPNTLVVGRQNGDLYLVDVSSPTSPLICNSSPFNAGDIINDISLGNDNNYAFIGTDSNSGELQVVNVSNPSQPSLVGQGNTTPNNDLNGVIYHAGKDRVFAVGDSDTEEFIVIRPQ